VQGVLAVTRAFGDRRLKTYVSAEPEIKSWPLAEGDDFLILASDGVWDVLNSQQAVDIVRQAVADTATSEGGRGDIKEAARRLTNAAYSYHSMDNITSLVVDLRQFR
jgi:serine/threonine protein phosphatase PrpC